MCTSMNSATSTAATASVIAGLQLGDLVMVQTGRELLVGNVKLMIMNSRQRIIELDNVRDFNTKHVFTTPQIIPVPLIISIQIIRDDKPNGNKSPAAAAAAAQPDTAGAQHPKADGTPIDSTKTPLRSAELEQLELQLANVVFINLTDHTYHQAIKDIKQQSIISLIVEPSIFGRHKRSALLAIATPTCVYIIDMLAMGQVFADLKCVLEASIPRKAVHYGHRIGDQLLHQYNVKFGGVFDTFVAHCLLTGVRKPLGLLETVEQQLCIPQSYFQLAEFDLPYDYEQRPLPQQLLTGLAKMAVLQLKLQEHQLHERMLSNFYTQCDTFSHAVSKLDESYEAGLQVMSNSRTVLENIDTDADWQELLARTLIE